MVVLVFVLGSLLGMLAGGALVVHHLRAEIAANIGPTLERMQNQLDLIEGAVDIALAKWYEALRHYPPRPPELPPSGLDDDNRPLRLVNGGVFDAVPVVVVHPHLGCVLPYIARPISPCPGARPSTLSSTTSRPTSMSIPRAATPARSSLPSRHTGSSESP